MSPAGPQGSLEGWVVGSLLDHNKLRASSLPVSVTCVSWVRWLSVCILVLRSVEAFIRKEWLKENQQNAEQKLEEPAECFNEKTLIFPVTFAPNTRSWSIFISVMLVCQQLLRPILKLKQNHQALTIYPDVSALDWFALGCEHKPASYSASLFFSSVCVSCKWT